ncbi:MAG: hypothetical protein KF891_04025 [Rhizobacter sp.]|nr:hypothetical protein [Rhizobacter sp.]
MNEAESQQVDEAAKTVVAWLVLAVKGQPMPSVDSGEHRRVLLSIQTVYEAAQAGAGGKALVNVGMGALVALLEAVRQASEAERQANGKSLS